MEKIIHEQLSKAIIGIAMEVLNELNPGLDEVLYERAMAIELRRRGHSVKVQESFPVFYRAELIGRLIPDMIVDNLVIVDPKVVTMFNETHIAQMIGYLNITRLKLALLLNFKLRALTLKACGSRKEFRSRCPRSSFLIFHPRHPRNPRFRECQKSINSYRC